MKKKTPHRKINKKTSKKSPLPVRVLVQKPRVVAVNVDVALLGHQLAPDVVPEVELLAARLLALGRRRRRRIGERERVLERGQLEVARRIEEVVGVVALLEGGGDEGGAEAAGGRQVVDEAVGVVVLEEVEGRLLAARRRHVLEAVRVEHVGGLVGEHLVACELKKERGFTYLRHFFV